MVRLIERVAVLEQKQREEDAAVALGRKVREGIEAYMAQDEQSEAEADAEAIQTGAAADPSLYFPC
jgi:hypothetical protein